MVYVGVLWPRSSVRHLIGPFFAPTAATARVRTAVSVILNEPPFWVEPCGSIAVTRMAAVGAQRKRVTLPTDFRSPSPERSFALRSSDGKVCPEPAVRGNKREPPVGWKTELQRVGLLDHLVSVREQGKAKRRSNCR